MTENDNFVNFLTENDNLPFYYSLDGNSQDGSVKIELMSYFYIFQIKYVEEGKEI